MGEGRKKEEPLPWELETLPERMKRAMKSRGIRTQLQLEKRCQYQIDQGTISRLLNGKSLRGVTAETILWLARGLEVETGWLLAGEHDDIPRRHDSSPPASSTRPSSNPGSQR